MSNSENVVRPTDSCDCPGFCQEKAGCRGLPRRMAMHNHASSAEKAACLVCNPAKTHWRDKRCIVCGGELPLPTWAGQPYICCSGNDCGCGGGTLPVEFCSVDCWDNYEPEPDEPPDDDSPLKDSAEEADLW
jgi:hypothetical protein